MTLRPRSARRDSRTRRRSRRDPPNPPGSRSRSEQRPNWVPSMNVRSGFVIDLGKERKRRRPAKLEPPRVSRLLAKAEQWRGEIDRGEVRNLTALARREGLSHVYVGHLLHLLRLHPAIRAAIAALPPGTPARLVTERNLRPLTLLSWERQVQQLGWLIQRSRTG